MFCAASMYAANTPYAILYGASGSDEYKNTLRFTCEEEGTYRAGGSIVALWSGDQVTNTGNQPGWYQYRNQIQKVTFDAEFSNVCPTSTANWFAECKNLTSIVGMESNLNTSEVTDMQNMFYYCKELTSLNVTNFNTENVTNMSGMFWLCNSISNINLSSFNTENVTDMSNMFCRCVWLNALDLSCFNTENVTNMSHMFDGCSYHSRSQMRTIDLSSFDTENVTTMREMFSNMVDLKTIDFGYFSTDNVTDMSRMFDYCVDLTELDLSTFNTSNVVLMDSMFYNCKALTTLNVSNFNTESVNSWIRMFYNCENLTTIYCNNDWTAAHSYHMFENCNSLKGATSYSSSISNPNDEYADPSHFFTAIERQALYCAGNNTLYFVSDGTTYAAGGNYDGQTITAVWNGVDHLSMSRNALPGWTDNYNNDYYDYIYNVVFDKSFANARPVSLQYWFYYLRSLSSITGIENLNTSETLTMKAMFSMCKSLTTLDLRHFNTNKVNNSETMFNYCIELTTIYCNDAWECEESDYMFASCNKLVGGNGVTYDEFELDGSYANPTTGYFTAAEGDVTEMTQNATRANVRGFGNDSETTDINTITTDASDANWYTLDGKVLNGMPSQKGMYIHGGKTVMIK